MKHDKEWYLAWTPGNSEYTRDDAIISVGMKCTATPYPLAAIINWLGNPDKVSGKPQCGDLVYYYDSQQETAALFKVINGKVEQFSDITRYKDNAMRETELGGAPKFFNILDEMRDYAGSEME
jgi:hypothetical protein